MAVMMEGGVLKGDQKIQFKECLNIMKRNPYIMKLAFLAGIGGLLFGYDTSVISGALLFIREDFKEVEHTTWLQETIVSMAVAGAIIGAGTGGWLSDKVGRKPTIIVSDVFLLIGPLIMSCALAPSVIITGRILVGIGVGMASMASPLYISETSPTRIRGAFVSTNILFLTGGQFVSYLTNLGFAKINGTWRWMLGVGALPTLLQLILMLSRPESPRWLFRKEKSSEAEEILSRIYPTEEVLEEMAALMQSIDYELALEGNLVNASTLTKAKKAFGNKVVRQGLYAGIIVQVAQQLVGINIIMYYSPTVLQLSGVSSNTTALFLSLITSGINAIGSILSMLFVDRYGRRKLMVISLFGIITSLVVMALLFNQATHAPMISLIDSRHFGANFTCPAYVSSPANRFWTCSICVKRNNRCAFCASKINHDSSPGACVVKTDAMQNACSAEQREYFTLGCPSTYALMAIMFLATYMIFYSPGLGTVPWIINSEIYPLRFRGVGGGIAAMANWTTNLIVSQTFLTTAKALGAYGTPLFYATTSTISLMLVYLLVPETKGLPIEEIEQILDRGYNSNLFAVNYNKNTRRSVSYIVLRSQTKGFGSPIR